MSTKEKIIKKLHQINDETILEDLLSMIELELTLTDEVVRLEKKQKKYIDEGLKDIKAGRTIPDSQAKQMINEWLRKK